MTRAKQLKIVRELLKIFGVERVRLVDCATIPGVKEELREFFLAPKIDTLFFCSKNTSEFVNVITQAFGENKFYYYAEYKEIHIGFSYSAFMKYTLETKYQPTPDNGIRLLRKFRTWRNK